MGKFSPIGIFYLHLTIITFGIIIAIALKNFNIAEYRATEVLSSNQISFIWFFLLIGLVGIIAFLIHGIGVKTPKYYRRAGAAIVIIILGATLLFGILFLDYVYYRDQSIGWLGILGMVISSLVTMIGSYGYISLKFPDESMMKYFKEAVREEIRSSRDEERQWQMYEAQLKREERARAKAAKLEVAAAKSTSKKKKVQAVKASSDAEEVTPISVAQAEMSPPESIGITVIKCSKCGRSLKLTSNERPITIKCPFCDTVGVIKE